MLKSRQVAVASLLFVVTAGVLPGCSHDSDHGMLGSGTGQLTVEIHDHPMPQIAECWITIGSVEARGQGGEWTHVAGDYPLQFDLLKLQGGQTRVLGSSLVPTDDYVRIRIQMTGARLIMVDGEEVNVPLPQGGIPIDVPIGRPCDVAEGSGVHVSLDFKVASSFFHNSDESWTCDPDVAVDDVWQHGQQGHHG